MQGFQPSAPAPLIFPLQHVAVLLAFEFMIIKRGHIVIPIPGTRATYVIDLKECQTLHQINQWQDHLSEKMWVTSRILSDFRMLALTQMQK